ncbi:MAG: hypothetical protein HDKAJFGB_02777 [Anaerolineae bacterium]|nr:hypothetical protein [Anaerolineae bacterium]
MVFGRHHLLPFGTFVERVEHRAQFHDLVAQQRRFFKFPLARRVLHLLFQIRNQFLRVALGHVERQRSFFGRILAARFRHRTHAVGEVFDFFDNALRFDIVFFIVRFLNRAAAIRFINRALHRVGHFVRVHDDRAVDVTRRAPRRLNQRRFTSQKTFLVRVQNCDQ